MLSPMPWVSRVRCSINPVSNFCCIMGITWCVVIHFISCGTPGMAIKMVPFFSNSMPGAVPTSFFKTVHTSGTSACFLLRSSNGPVRLNTFSNRYCTCANVGSSSTIFPPKYSHSKGLVISSAVGPRPPVNRMISACLLSSSNAFHISS